MLGFVTAHDKQQGLGNALSEVSGLRLEPGKNERIPDLALHG